MKQVNEKQKPQRERPSARSARLPLNAVRVFEAVAAHRSFSAAADALHVTTAAVSMQIKSLEQYLQVRLFRRNRRDVQLTEEGECLLPYVRRGLDELELGFRAVKSSRRGALVISVLNSFLQRWFLPRLPSFRDLHPKVDLQIRASPVPVDFARDDAHVAIRFGAGGWPGVHAERLMDEWLVAVCTPKLLKRYGRLRGPGDTGDYPLLHSLSEPWDIWLTGNDEGKELWPVTGMAFDDSVAVLHAAEQGQGLALVRWSLAADEIAKGHVVLAHAHALRFARSYHFVCPESYLTLPKVAVFREWLFRVAEASPKPPG
ncbi:MAG TPA: transcriptional regulator GcvA [Gammaproteobacteria bacterium]|nr:transcriptional regulator GcvA [Gammaproteobacteria bacterium]